MKRSIFLFQTVLCLYCAFLAVCEPNGTKSEDRDREGKVFSLFNIVQFNNDPCSSNSHISGGTSRNGTCVTGNECSGMRGVHSGSCASGFGVCCVFILRATGSSMIRRNCTYVQNPGFPAIYTAAAGIQYDVIKCRDDVCAVRLDFESFSITGPSNTLEDTDCIDSFTITSSTNQQVPVICGLNSGEHMYVDMGMGPNSVVSSKFTFVGEQANRKWEIKFTQIPCAANYCPPEGCLQWHIGLTGRIATFNFQDATSSHLYNQQYTQCIRRAAGFCCVQYQICQDENSFSLDHSAAAPGATAVDTACTNLLDFIQIQGATSVCQPLSGITLTERICGRIFSSFGSATVSDLVCDCSPPFQIGIRTNGVVDANSGDTPNRGLCLEYTQIPC